MAKRIKKTLLIAGLSAIVLAAGASLYLDRQRFLQDENNGTVTPVGRMRVQRAAHTATLLKDGQILIAGGMESAEGVERNTDSAELFDPRTGTFKPTGRMTMARGGHTATLLENGDILLTGGFDQGDALKSAEIYHPDAGTFTATGPMAFARDRHAATRLQDATVLITGGNSVSSSAAHVTAEIYDPASARFHQIANMTVPRSAHSTTLLNDGSVLVAGGSMQLRAQVVASAEIYSPLTRSFTRIESMTAPRHKHAATLLHDGSVLITGGSDNALEMSGRKASAEIFDFRQRNFRVTGSLITARFKLPAAALTLKSGDVLIAGDGKYLELYKTGAGVFGTVSGGVGDGWMYSCAVELGDGSVLITGGYNRAMTVTSGAWIYKPKLI